MNDKVAELTPYWVRMEVPRGFNAELSRNFTYIGDEIEDDPDSLWCVVAYLELEGQAVTFQLMEVYDNYHL